MTDKKDLIRIYVDLKKENPDPRFKIKRTDFLQKADLSRRNLTKLFGSWTDFREEAENAYLKTLSQKQHALLSELDKNFDPDASKENCIQDLRDLQDANWGKHLTRDFYRHNGKYSDSTWSRFFGTFQEFRRQASLELNRHQHSLERGIAKQASLDHYRSYFQSEVLPYFDKYKKNFTGRPGHIRKILAMSDLHDKECCQFSLSVFIETCRLIQPDVICLNGDIYDMLEFGKYPVDIRHIDIVGRFNFVRERVFAPLRAACPDAQIDLIAGNHEMRLLHLLANSTPNVRVLLSDVMGLSFKDVFGLDEFEINWASKFDLGAYSNQDIKNEIKKNYRIYFGSFVFAHIPDKRLLSMSGSNGHHHQGKIAPNVFIDPRTELVKQVTWSQTPGMHLPDAEYLSNSCGWDTGFLEVTINLKLMDAKQKIHHTNHGWCEINGIYYGEKDFI